MKVIPETRHAH